MDFHRRASIWKWTSETCLCSSLRVKCVHINKIMPRKPDICDFCSPCNEKSLALRIRVPIFGAVFRIHDILVWIRIRIRESMPLTNGSGTFTSFFKDKKSKRSHKRVRIKVFLMIKGSGSGARSGSTPLTNGSGSARPKNIWIRWIRNTALEDPDQRSPLHANPF
jgi:hypothetical protein